MLSIDINGPEFADKVYGCWLAKNAGGTLGTPLEKAYGDPEPLDVWWYTQVEEGGLPNDDLELQLIWLKAVEEIGPGLTARDLARYWLDHVVYNPDEYGQSKANLMLGLEPPVSGSYNNWFKDCMGCPIRSEIWACLAPGKPRIAARYAYLDAICDHAGGESVYGELFNVAVESAAFVIDDVQKLIDIGLSYVPATSLTAKTIIAARDGHAAGLDWKETRKKVLEAAPHYNAQYSPLNMGFQVIGLLYGTDFGEGICITVNCGYDTDSSGATTGSYLGILQGRSGMSPTKWLEPLGDTISTTEKWNGIKNVSTGRNPIPANLDDLFARIKVAAQRVLTAHGAIDVDGRITVDESELYADAEIIALRDSSPTAVQYPGPDLHVEVEYLDTPAVVADSVKRIQTTIRNVRPEPIRVTASVAVPGGWTAPAPEELALAAYGEVVVGWDIPVPARHAVGNSNVLSLSLVPVARPPYPTVPIVLIGGPVVRIGELIPGGGRSDGELLAAVFPPEEAGDVLTEGGRPGAWRTATALGNGLPLADALTENGVLYVQQFVEAPADQEAWLSVEANHPVSFWFNGEHVATAERYNPIRPNFGGRQDSSNPVRVKEGWNEILIKLVRGVDAPAPIECHLLLVSGDESLLQPWDERTEAPDYSIFAGLPHLGLSRLPWD